MKIILKSLGILSVFLMIAGIFNKERLTRVYQVIRLFDEDRIVYNFQNMDQLIDCSTIKASPHPYQFPRDMTYELPTTFDFEGKPYNTADYFKHTNTEGFIVLHKDSIIFEEYYNGLKENTNHISWSVAKSFVSTLMGIAHDEGLVDLEKTVTDYLPQFKDTGYDGVRIKDVLQMSSGVKFNEDYTDFNSDINRFGRTIAMNTSFEEFSKSLTKDREPGTYCHYVSIDTQVIGFILAKVTGKSLTAYLQEKIWDPMGMEFDAKWIVDNEGFEMALGGMNVTLRDYAKLGQLFLHEGKFNGKQIVSREWVKAATTPDAPHLMPGDNGLSSHNYGYGYQWWIPQDDEGAFFAAGIYNQYIYIKPSKDLVFVKLSANHHFKTEGALTKDVHTAMFKSFVDQFEI